MKRAIAIGGGGPTVGIAIGVLKRIEEKKMNFDVWSLGCVGAWAGCVYLSAEDGKRFEHTKKFFEATFIPDDVFKSYPVGYTAFGADWQRDFTLTLQKLMNPDTYSKLVLPERMMESFTKYAQNPPQNQYAMNRMIGEFLALNPMMRLWGELNYRLPKSGMAGLITDASFLEGWIDWNKLYHLKEDIYFNLYNLTKKQLELVTNKKSKQYKQFDAKKLFAASSVLHYAENPIIDGDAYCEGAVIDTVNFKDLVENHPDLDEVYVIRITDYKSTKPPKDVSESEYIAIMQLFDTIADDDVKLFKWHLKEMKLDQKIKVIEIPVSYEKVCYSWTLSNLQAGIEAGYAGAKQVI